MSRKQKKIRTFEGLPVVDASSDVTLHIKKCDIDNSKKKDPNNCAAARAGKREFNTEVKVFLTRTYVKKDKKWIRFFTPNNVTREIISFDRGSSFEPGEYTLKSPAPSGRLGLYHPGKGKGTHTGKKRHTTHNVRISAKEGYRTK